MADDISVALKMTDNVKDMAARMRGNLTDMRTNLEALGKELTTLNTRKLDLKVDMTRAKKELSDATKAFRDTGSEADALRLKAAEADYSNISGELSMITTQAKETQKAMLNASDAFRKADEQAGKSSALGQLAQAGLFRQAGQALAGSATTLLTSGMSSDAGNVVGSMLSGAIDGAAMGMLSGNPMIALAGAAMGAGTSLISGLTQVYENQSEAMKSYVSDLYGAVTQATLDSLEAGSAMAGGRETTMVSFSTLLGGKENAAGFLEQIKDLANTTPFLYDDLTSMSKGLLTYGFRQEELIPSMTAVGDTGAALGMDTSNMNMVITALGRMKSTDKTSLEYLNLLTERGIGATDWLAQRDNISVGQVYENISKGKYSGKETADYLIQKMQELYGGMMEEQSKTFEGLTSTLEGLRGEVDNARGMGYNEERKEGLTAEVDYLNGEMGRIWQENNKMAGEGQAYLDNLKDEYKRQSMTALLTGSYGDLLSPESVEQLRGLHQQYIDNMSIAEGDDKEDAAIAGVAIGKLQETAQGIAENEYIVSDAAQAVVDMQQENVDALRANTEALKAYQPGYQMSQTLTKGMSGPIDYLISGLMGENVDGVSGRENTGRRGRYQIENGPNGDASGRERVPKTGLYLLHENERVLRAADQGGGGGVSVSVSVGQLVVREEADVRKVAEYLAEEARLQAMAGVYEQ